MKKEKQESEDRCALCHRLATVCPNPKTKEQAEAWVDATRPKRKSPAA